MPVTLRKRLQCHYCGKRLNTAKRTGSRVPCDNCSADNYFDVDNNIVDVPEFEASRPDLQAHLPQIESESDIFCRKCLTNQAFFVEALSNYLPDENDPQYERLLHDLPEFERNLEIRYPQCCTQCEPRVNARIQEANYMAKSDHLRRILHRTHDRRRASQLRLRSLLISAAGLSYTVSLGIQLLWHALSSQAQDIVPDITPTQCLRQWPVPAQCTHYVASFLPLSLLTGLLCIWWNPQWQHRLTGKEGRLVGLGKYYQVQFLIMALRVVAWVGIQDLPALRERSNAVHTVLLVVLSTTSIYALTSIVQVDTTPLVDWHQVQPPLVRPDQFRPPSETIYSPPSSQDASRLNITNFAAPPSSMYEPWKPPTPPTEDDSMDWTPSTHDFHPQPRIPKPKFEQKSPFYGNLPAAPVRGSLNPKAPPPPPQRKALGLPPGFFGLSKSSRDDQQAPVSQTNASDAFAPPKFFPDKRESDTGLENIFDKMFSVRDPLETQVPTHNPRPASGDVFGQSRATTDQSQFSQSARQEQFLKSNQPPFRMVLSCTIIVTLAVIASSLCSLEFLYGATTSTPSTLLPYTALIPVAHLLEEAFYTSQIEILGLTISAIEIVFAIATYIVIPVSGTNLVPIWNKMVIGVVFFFLLQEIYHFCQLQNTPARQQSTFHTAPVVDNTFQQSPPVQQQYIEETAISHPSPQQQPRHGPPTQISHSAFSTSDFGTVRKRDSDESISSVSSITTTSTASGWKTPQNTGRTYDWQSSTRQTPRARNPSLGLGSLSLGNDFGSGTGIAGPRDRPTQANRNGRPRY